MHNRPSDSKGGNELLDEILKAERRDVLDLTQTRREGAARLDGGTARVAHEHYLVTVDQDIPLISERVRITRLEGNEVAEEVFLYLPYDVPSLVFITKKPAGQEPKRYVVSKNKTSAFEGDEEVQLDVGHFLVPDDEFDADLLFPDAQELKGEEEFRLLADLKSILADAENYRFAAQDRPNAA